MISLWIIIGLISCTVSVLIFHALIRPSVAKPRSHQAFNLAVYMDQLSELERDLRRGLVAESDADGARTEIERRILSTTNTIGRETGVVKAARKGVQLLFAITLAGVVPGAALALYIVLGSPDIPNIPYASRNIPAEKEKIAEQLRLRETQELAASLETKLKNEPNNIKAWVMLGRTYLALGQILDAQNALETAHGLAPNDPNVLVQYAESLIPLENNVITERIRDLFNRAFIANPRHPKARYYLALAKAQANDIRGAMQDWVDLIAISPKAVPWLNTVHSQINAAAHEIGIDPNSLKPSAEAVALGSPDPPVLLPRPPHEALKSASKMSITERKKMIRSMVQRLAERLKKNPDDPGGWRRLAHAYRVLGDRAKAANAEARAKATNR